jgi:hypothetical protein
MPLVGLVSRYTLYLSSGENGLSHEPAYHQGSGAGEFLRVVLYAEQMILRISAGRLVVDRLDGDHASGMPNLERGGDRRPILCRDQERCPASLSLTAPLSSRSIRQPTADRLIVVAFLHISSIGPNQKLHAHPLHPSIHPSFQPRLPTPGFKSSVSNLQRDRSSERQRWESTCPASIIYRLLSDFGKGRVVLDDQIREVDVVSDGSTMRREGVKVTVRFNVRGRDRSRAKNKEGTGTSAFASCIRKARREAECR